ncbi:hypothetical protein B0T24DRAFT_88341 [Lasiosphaeria ovina]|uniref:Uncharacterized protein n=1 Tax=Lasiosphaeria ovina TaxID=92902 RepID=A0AAE0TYT4_9PEZI|nr:hypothetical protein B0T24DRAFT_88341 [Lasiosphaeria ovina]
MTFAGGMVPRAFLWDACQPKMWGPDGNVLLLKSALPGALENTQRCEEAIQQLLKARAIHASSTNSQELFSVDPVFVSHVMKIEPSGSKERTQALMAMFYAFPKDSHLDPAFFTSKGLLMIPVLRFLLPSLWLEFPPPARPILELAFETFLSASYFADYSWKREAARIAEQLAHLLRSPVHLARANFRKASLSRLYDYAGLQLRSLMTPTGIDARTNAWLGQLTLSAAQALIDKSAYTRDVAATLRDFCPLEPSRPSHQEGLILLDGEFLVTKSLRFEGRFEEAEESFKQVLARANELGSRISWKVSSHFGEVQSERGFCEKAIGMLEDDIAELEKYQPLEHGSGNRLRLALANCYLMNLLWTWKQECRPLATESIRLALEHFQLLDHAYLSGKPASFMAKHNQFVARSGLAMVHHIGNNFQEALAAWEEAEQVARTLCEEPGYAAMITLYSRSQIAYHLGVEEAEELNRRARELWELIGRR